MEVLWDNIHMDNPDIRSPILVGIVPIKEGVRHDPNRIGIDIDRSYLNALKAYFNARYLGKTVVRKTAHGWHIILYAHNDPETNIKVRATLGDDPNRLAIDEDRIIMRVPMKIDVLFSFKWSKEGYISIEEDCDILSLPWFSKIRRSHFIKKYRR